MVTESDVFFRIYYSYQILPQDLNQQPQEQATPRSSNLSPCQPLHYFNRTYMVRQLTKQLVLFNHFIYSIDILNKEHIIKEDSHLNKIVQLNLLCSPVVSPQTHQSLIITNKERRNERKKETNIQRNKDICFTYSIYTLTKYTR